MYSPFFNFGILGFDICYQASMPLLRTSSKHQETLRKYCRITELTLLDTHSAQSIGHVSFTAFQVELNMSALCLTLATGTGSYHVHPLSKYARNCCILWPNFPLFHTHLHPSDSLDSWLLVMTTWKGWWTEFPLWVLGPCPTQPGTYLFTFARSLSFPLFAEGVVVAGVPFRHD